MLNIDCMEYMATLPDNAFDLAICDPPYGIKQLSVNENRSPNSKFRRSMSAMVDSAKSWNKDKPSKKYFEELFRVSKEQIVWGANNFTLPESEYFCIWDKHQTIDNFASAEYAWVSSNFWKKPAKVFRYQIHKCNAEQVKIHPTQKPIKLYSWLLQNYAEKGQRILDTHGGSFSSAIAAHYFGCDMVICEIDEDYYKAGCERFKKETSQIAMF
jgi:site-specific DNA-methyltransferase (adenine-specific)